jgi:hypothetical protein
MDHSGKYGHGFYSAFGALFCDSVFSWKSLFTFSLNHVLELLKWQKRFSVQVLATMYSTDWAFPHVKSYKNTSHSVPFLS